MLFEIAREVCMLKTC